MRRWWVVGTMVLSIKLLGGQAQAEAAPTLDWLAFGDLRGHFESCGCDPLSDFGGVARLASLVARERAEHPDLLVFDTGNDFFIPPKPGLKNRYIASGLARVAVTATLVNKAELMSPPTLWGARPFVLSNVRPGGGEHPVVRASQRYIEAPQAVVFGYVRPAGVPEAWFLTDWQGFLAANQRELSSQSSAKPKVLLFSGPSDDLAKAAASGLFALIVSSHTAEDGASPSFPGQEIAGEAFLQRSVGPYLLPMVPLGGMGVLRGGRLRQKEALPLKALLSQSQSPVGGELSLQAGSGLGKKPSASAAFPASLMPKDVPVSWLGRSYEEHSPLGDLLAAYAAEAKEAFHAKQQKQLALARAERSPYAGAQACQSCHPQAFRVWEQSAHAHAYLTLQGKGKHEDGECVACHVVAYSEAGGFSSLAVSPHLAHVQCENCHGPRRDHSENPTIKSKHGASLAVCQSCHHNPHSPAFAAKAYWQKIKHGKEGSSP